MIVESITSNAFHSVLCGIDGSQADAEAARQAAILAGPSAHLELVSVTSGAAAQTAVQPPLTRAEAGRALRSAHAIAVSCGARPIDRIVEHQSDPDGLLDEAPGHDLIVVGPSDELRLIGIVVASVATHAAHSLPCPVLVSRKSPTFPNPILVADDGHDISGEAVRLAAAIAAQHNADVVVAAPFLFGATRRALLQRHADVISLATGREPTHQDVDQPPAKSIVDLARRLGSGLIVMGSSRKRGLRSLASVSERVAHGAPCSVLIVPASN
jgi:nucleotide-binding universal stress UspA family protein